MKAFLPIERTSSFDQIDRRSNLSYEEFIRDYVKKKRPVHHNGRGQRLACCEKLESGVFQGSLRRYGAARQIDVSP